MLSRVELIIISNSKKILWRNLCTPTRLSEHFIWPVTFKAKHIYSKISMAKISLKFSATRHLYETSFPKCSGNSYTNKNMNLLSPRKTKKKFSFLKYFNHVSDMFELPVISHITLKLFSVNMWSFLHFSTPSLLATYWLYLN